MNKHPNNFDFVRLVAASLVIWGHAYPLLAEPGLPFLMGSSIHTFAVKVFFAVSGYLVVASWVNDPNPLRFSIKRILRIVPALALVVIVSALILGPSVTNLPLSEYFSNPALPNYFNNILLKIRYALPGVFDENSYPSAVNGSLWTLPVEATMYLFVLLCGLGTYWRSSALFKLVWLLLTLILLMFAASRAFLFPELLQGLVFFGILASAFLDVSPYFMVGGCLFLFARWIPQLPSVAVATLIVSFTLSDFFSIFYALNIFILSYAVIVFGNKSTPYIRQAGKFGDFSYGLYLYGFPVAQTLSWAFNKDIPFLAHIILTLTISFLCAIISWHSVEKPALSLRRLFYR